VNSIFLNDEVSYLDIGFAAPREFFTYSPSALGLSYSDEFGPDKYYKTAGFTIFRNFDFVVYNRATYDVLAFLGDVGGLEGILFLILGAVIAKTTGFFTTFRLLPDLYYERNEEKA